MRLYIGDLLEDAVASIQLKGIDYAFEILSSLLEKLSLQHEKGMFFIPDDSSYLFMAPELRIGDEKAEACIESDIFSFGAIMFYILTGRELNYIKDILSINYNWIEEIKSRYPELCSGRQLETIVKVLIISLMPSARNRYHSIQEVNLDILLRTSS